ncbi:MAG TPA: bacillithiol transferase BstA [Terracidiphilus sp.]|nr:bacillithiol transferase BstA [Terracidiphilus sp.]
MERISPHNIMTEEKDLRYPVGRFNAAEAATPAARAANLETLKAAPEHLRAAVSGLSDVQLDTPYREGGWTIRQVVHHLADSHANAYIRVKLALTEEWPTVKPYDEAAWAKLADSREPIEGSLAMFAALHSRWVALMESLREEDFQKGFMHPALGRQTLDASLGMYAWHSRHHTAHITSLRARQGW